MNPATAATAATTTEPAPAARAVDALAAEWAKLVSLRGAVALVVSVGLALPALAVIVAATGSLQPDDTILGASVLGGAALAQVLAGSFGAMTLTGELRTGQMALTLCATPRRGRVVATKALLTAGVVFVASLIGASAALGFGWLLIDRARHDIGEPMPALVGVAAAISAIGVLGVAVGAVVRNAAGAVGVVVGLVVVPGVFAPMFGDAQRWVGGASLTGVMQKLTQSTDATPDTVGTLGAWPSLLVVAGYTLAAVVVAAVVLRRRDLA